LKREGLSFQVKAITTTAEPLTEEHRTLFREVFHAETFDQYGFGEIGGVAFECDAHEGLHITEERVIVEVNDKNELIVTDLDNFAMPFIRYHNADQAILSDIPCSCGRKSRLIKKIMGRTCDYITGMNGEFLHWAYFWHLFFDSAIAEKRDLRKFQIVQTSPNDLKIRLVANPLDDEERQVLIDNIQSRVGKMNIIFSFEPDIENSASGKYRPVINHLL
jgi:phenylacetate-CoA ligase